MKRVSLLFWTACLVLTSACSNEASLQRYFVDKLDDKDFVSLDFAPGTLIENTNLLSEENQKTLKSVKKINFLALQKEKTTTEKWNAEKATIETILKQEEYKNLLKYGSKKQGFAMYFTGQEEAIDEVVVFGSSDENGLGLVRVLGNNMNPSAILQLVMEMDSQNIDISVFEEMAENFQ